MLIIGVGNEMRGDDGVGIVVVRNIAERRLPGVVTDEATGEGATLMERWQGADAVVLVDAVQSGGEPGTVYRLDARAESLPSRFFHYSTHAFSVAEAIELARVLDRLPDSLVVYGIEGARYEPGVGLSPEVSEAAAQVVEKLAEELQRQV